MEPRPQIRTLLNPSVPVLCVGLHTFTYLLDCAVTETLYTKIEFGQADGPVLIKDGHSEHFPPAKDS